MKFALKQVSACGARRGILSDIERLHSFEMDTPNVLLYTQGGSVPHVTPDVLQLISPAPQAILIPTPSIAVIEDRMKCAKMNIAEFVGLKNLATFATIIDPGRERLEGFHKKNILSVSTRGGKKEYTADSYMDFIDSLKPDIFMALCDGDVNATSSVKRATKSTSRSQAMLTACVERWKDSDSLQKSELFVPLEGGLKVELRHVYAEEVKKIYDGSGVVIDGLGQYGGDVVKRDAAEFLDFIRASVEPCGNDKLRVLLGPWHPRAVLSLMELGIDLFDTTYAHLVTERGCALILTNDSPDPAKKPKPLPIEIDLNDAIYAECFEPISDCCTCVACKNHTRAYIHHLLVVKEMLASVLLSIHNLQQYLQFFSSTRQAIKNGSFQLLKETFQ